MDYTPEQLEALRKTITVSQTYLSCLVAVLVYDWFISLWAEYDRFWTKPWGILKVAFLFNRYFGMATVWMCLVLFNNLTNLSNAQCKNIILIEPIFVLIMMVTAELILIMRVYALYERATWVLLLFAVLMCAECATSIWALVGSIPVPIPDGAPFKACIATGGPGNASTFWVYWLPPLLVDSVIIVLTLWRIYHIHARASHANIPILNLLMRDGLLYYGIVFVANVLNVISFRTRRPEDNQALNAPLAMVLTTLSASRLCLSMRDPANNEGSVTGAMKKNRHDRSEHITGVKTIPTYPLDEFRISGVPGGSGMGGDANHHHHHGHQMPLEDEEKKIAYAQAYSAPCGPGSEFSEHEQQNGFAAPRQMHHIQQPAPAALPGILVNTHTTSVTDARTPPAHAQAF